jgi:4,5-dihydroxyphthalate decarboxylase
MPTTDLQLSFPLIRYDITMPLLEGRVDIPGVRLKPTPTGSMVGADVPALREGNFGLWDLNLGYLLPAIEAGWQVAALPVFSKRKPAYQFIFCRNDITEPRQLEGKRIGARSYRTALTIWARGLLRHRHEVDVAKMRWVIWADEYFPIHDTTTSIIHTDDPKKSPVDSLLGGDVDALITDISDDTLFAKLEGDDRVHRLFEDYEADDHKLGFYTPVHLIVMSRKLIQQQPDLAKRLFDAFVEAKRISDEDILSDRSGFSVVYLRERMKEQRERWGDPYRHGFAANKAAIEAFFAYNLEQGLVQRAFSYEEVFAEATLET